ncbi:helix-turn-helix domain-containing protein [Bacteroides reticulotermitis]|uniref:HTH cro/C1-type domain-containing protein n=2 Tax=Bacteroides reticulotermitis TaxID=1133319 RepID=W4UQF6_9BACE|nr:helix-turn-helix transcriptional regulator [Bacteroides reticulotermitis]MBB4044908.1 transcriptional regulator with XRE-family HTH domain [Bacteroides reticulotermitis]GAE82754.1 hypothetical protein JCM10512_983 [Bacteroides reticulotermitis JCM 10512]
MDIATNIRRLREQQGLIQKQVVHELGIGYSNYNKMENGSGAIGGGAAEALQTVQYNGG